MDYSNFMQMIPHKNIWIQKKEVYLWPYLKLLINTFQVYWPIIQMYFLKKSFVIMLSIWLLPKSMVSAESFLDAYFVDVSFIRIM